MSQQVQIVLDSDVIIHFIKGNCLSILPKILPQYKYVILSIVYDRELSRDSSTKAQIDNQIRFLKNIQIIPWEPDSNIIKEFARLNNSLAKLMQKDKEIYRIQKEFTENASHELQTPISIIRSKLDLLMQEELDERSMNLVSDLYDLNTRMEHLNRNLLLLAKIENSQYTEMEEVDLGNFIREAMPTYNVLHSDLNISFLDQRTCHVVHNVNTILLSCLLNNLVVNAIRHTAAMNGEIRLLLCNSYFTVSNPADGVSLNARTLFQRFSSDDTKASGNGLGLSIAKAICDYHGWRLQYVFEENHHVFSVYFR